MWWKCRKICSFVCWECYLLQRNSCWRTKFSDISGKFGDLVSWPSNLHPEKRFLWYQIFWGLNLKFLTTLIFFRVALWRFFLIYGNPTFFRLPPWKKSGLSEHDVLGFETNLDISNQTTRCRLNGRVDGISYIYPCVLKTLEGTKLLQICKA